MRHTLEEIKERISARISSNMKYTPQDIKEAIKNRYIIQDYEGSYCIPTRIDNKNRVYGIWHTDINLTIPCYSDKNNIPIDIHIGNIVKIYSKENDILDTNIQQLFNKLGYE